jgi:hypothetical protein
MPRRVVDLLACWRGLVVLRMHQCGRLFRLAFCGVFGGKRIIEVLNSARG